MISSMFDDIHVHGTGVCLHHVTSIRTAYGARFMRYSVMSRHHGVVHVRTCYVVYISTRLVHGRHDTFQVKMVRQIRSPGCASTWRVCVATVRRVWRYSRRPGRWPARCRLAVCRSMVARRGKRSRRYKVRADDEGGSRAKVAAARAAWRRRARVGEPYGRVAAGGRRTAARRQAAGSRRYRSVTAGRPGKRTRIRRCFAGAGNTAVCAEVAYGER